MEFICNKLVRLHNQNNGYACFNWQYYISIKQEITVICSFARNFFHMRAVITNFINCFYYVLLSKNIQFLLFSYVTCLFSLAYRAGCFTKVDCRLILPYGKYSARKPLRSSIRVKQDKSLQIQFKRLPERNKVRGGLSLSSLLSRW